jgi:hypothetical protein
MGEMGRSWKGTPHGIDSLILHLPLVVNIISSRLVLEFFFPWSTLCTIFFTLTFVDMFWTFYEC